MDLTSRKRGDNGRGVVGERSGGTANWRERERRDGEDSETLRITGRRQ